VAKKTRMPTDLNQRGKAIVELATGEREVEDPYKGKNPAAVELGRLGGKRGGIVRAEKLTAEQRSDISKKAAAARWHRRSP
jgi:hypothetical protein